MNKELEANTTLSHYRIVSKIGAGGMGEVYLAQDTKLGRKVALKFLPSDITKDKDRLRRFEQEARAASALNHPNIITIYEIGEADGSRFMATEFVDGETLRPCISGDPLEFGEALRIAEQVASALSSAHAVGIIHRDIKPENIMLRRDGIVKVLDFGLAKLMEEKAGPEDATRAMVRTGSGVVMGTVPYMSPEQARGLPVDARTDVWSLGVMLYEMVAGCLPFAGETASDVIALILQKEPPALTTVSASIPERLDEIVTKALAKDREERYQTIKDLALDLKRLRQKLEIEREIERTQLTELRGTTVRTAIEQPRVTASSIKYLASRFKANKTGAFFAIVGLVILAATVAYYFTQRSAQPIDSIAVLPLANGSNDPNMEYLSDGITDSIISSLSQLRQLRVMAQSTVFRYKGKAIDPQTVGRELKVRAVLLGKVMQQGDNLTISTELVNVADGTQLWGGQYDRKVSDLLALKQEIAQEIAEKLRLRLTGPEQKRLNHGGTNNNEAYQFYLKGRYYSNKRTGESIKKAIEQFQRAIDQDPNFALAHVGLANSYLNLEDYAGARSSDTVPPARKSIERALQIDDSLSEAHATLGHVYEKQWLWQESEKELKHAISLDPNYSFAHHWYGNWFRNMGRFAEATVETRRAQELDPLSLVFNSALATTSLVTGDIDAAIKESKRALEIEPNYASAHNYLGMAYLAQGHNAEAIAELQKAVDLSQRSSRRLRALACAFAVSGKRGEALAILKEVEENYANNQASGQDVAAVYIALGDSDRAFEWLEKDFQARSGLLSQIRWEPYFNPIRTDARYADLLRRMGLPP